MDMVGLITVSADFIWSFSVLYAYDLFVDRSFWLVMDKRQNSSLLHGTISDFYNLEFIWICWFYENLFGDEFKWVSKFNIGIILTAADEIFILLSLTTQSTIMLTNNQLYEGSY